MVLQELPAGVFGHEKRVFGLVFVLVLGVGPGVVARAGLQLGVMLLEGIGNVFEEDEAQHDVLVLGGIDVFAELVGGFPELLFERLFGNLFLLFGHGVEVLSLLLATAN